MITIGEWLAHHIISRGLSNAAVARHLSVGSSTVGMWRTGQNDVSRHIIIALCDWWELDDEERLRALALPVSVDEDEGEDGQALAA